MMEPCCLTVEEVHDASACPVEERLGGRSGVVNGACPTSSEEASQMWSENQALVQLRARTELKAECSVTETSICPGSGARCAGNQCCPRTAESGDLTFPCPSADNEFAGCDNNTKLDDCREATSCCYSFGYGSMMEPCCLTVQEVHDASACPVEERAGGRSGVVNGACPTSS